MWYYTNGTGPNNGGSHVLDALLPLLTGSIKGLPGTKAGGLDGGGGFFSGSISNFMNSQHTTNPPVQAGVYWLLLDEQLAWQSGNGSGSGLVGADNTPRHFVKDCGNAIEVQKSGYIYVCTANQSNIDVFFDKLQVSVVHGPLLEETHYYPFGLTMQGISSKAANKLDNKLKYNGIEQNNDFDLNIGEAFFRTHDPQLGRWWQIDPKAIEGVSPYASMNNNPLLLSDPLGDTTWIYNQNGVFCGVVNDRMKNQVHYIKTGNDPGKPFDASKLNAKEAKTLAQSFRQSSIAFIGSKTASDMRAIVNQANSQKKELGFVGTIGKDKEIRLQALPVGELSGLKQTDMSVLDKNYSSAQQNSNLFLEGHTHIAGYLAGFWADDGSDMSNQKGFGEPTNPQDYAPQLDRGSQKGAAPALLLTQWGVTVYGTSATAPPMGQVNPNNSYLIYKNLKK